jgi:hypothetical protein
MFTVPGPALPAMVNLALIMVLFTNSTWLTAINAPPTLTLEPYTKPVPVRVTATLWPGEALSGLIDFSAGGGSFSLQPHPVKKTTRKSTINHGLLAFRVPIGDLAFSDTTSPSPPQWGIQGKSDFQFCTTDPPRQSRVPLKAEANECAKWEEPS